MPSSCAFSQYRFGPGTRVDQEAATVDLEQCREPPHRHAVLGVAREPSWRDVT